jgi:hypothetical protein
MAAVMEKPNERLCETVSTAELERRWKAAREYMRKSGIDALVMQNSNDFLGGYYRWFVGQPATHAYPRAALFPVEGLMSVVNQGNYDSVIKSDGKSHPNYGIGQRRAVCTTRRSSRARSPRRVTRPSLTFPRHRCTTPSAWA